MPICLSTISLTKNEKWNYNFKETIAIAHNLTNNCKNVNLYHYNDLISFLISPTIKTIIYKKKKNYKYKDNNPMQLISIKSLFEMQPALNF